MARVFLSYARADAERVHQLADALAGCGHKVWWDDKIYGGSRYTDEIDRKLNESDAVVVLWSASSVSSTWVLDEAAEGRDLGKLVPTLFGPCRPPLGFRQYETIDLSSWNGGTRAPQQLLDAIANADATRQYQIRLMGAFQLTAPDGEPIHIHSRKAMALMAMLATARGGERTRAWLQDRLWRSRARPQAQQCLRRELGNLRKLWAGGEPLIIADYDTVRIDLSRCLVDIGVGTDEGAPAVTRPKGEFLEGLDIPGEEGFEDWLREQRVLLAAIQSTPKPDLQAARGGRDRSQTQRSHDRPVVAIQAGRGEADAEPSPLQERVETELIDRLARVRWLSVTEPVATNTSDAEPDYVVHLEVPRPPAEDLLTVTLVQPSSSRTLLLRRIDASKSGGNPLTDAMREIVAAIDNQIETSEQQRVLRRPLGELAPYEIIWRARWHLDRLTKEDAAVAGELVEGVLRDSPEWAEALIQAGFAKAWAIWATRGSKQQIREVRSLGTRAVAADKFDARGYHLIGMADTWLCQPIRACLALEEAVSLNPSLSQAFMQLGSALYLAGDAKAALGPMETALWLNPRDTHLFCVLAERGMVHLMLGNWSEAVQSAEAALLRKPGYWFAHITKINSLVRMGDCKKAKEAYADLMRAKPDFTFRYFDWLPFVDEEWPKALRQGLEAAERS